MPRWLMSDRDLNEVIAFLKTLPQTLFLLCCFRLMLRP